jgi:hypothetical protein
MFKKFFASFLFLSLLGTFPAQANSNLPESFAGGAISGSQILIDKGSPYTITSPIDIPEAAELLIEPGVVIRTTSTQLFRLQGSLLIRGSAEKKVRIYPRGEFVIPIGGTGGEARRLEISHAHINGGQPLNMFYPGVREFAMLDSDLINQNCSGSQDTNWIKIQNRSSTIQRNFFEAACGLELHVTYGALGPRGTFNVLNNHFKGNAKSDGWIQPSSLWKDSVTLTGNSFVGVTKKAVFGPTTPVFVEDNFWGSLTLEGARQLVDGSMASTFTPATVNLTRLLLAPAASTPVGPHFVEPVEVKPEPTSSPTPTASTAPTKPTPVKVIRYANCKAMQSVHAGGVAKSSTSKNKGAQSRFAPIVNSRLYAVNASLDRDKDGIACER